MKQLYELSRKFPKDWIKKAPKGKFGNYVPHPVITQRLLEVCGPFDWEVVELIRQETTGTVQIPQLSLPLQSGRLSKQSSCFLPACPLWFSDIWRP